MSKAFNAKLRFKTAKGDLLKVKRILFEKKKKKSTIENQHKRHRHNEITVVYILALG